MKRAIAWAFVAAVVFAVYKVGPTIKNPWSINPADHGIPSCKDKGACL